MVLHKSKWDKKATRAYERKLRAKGIDPATVAGFAKGGKKGTGASCTSGTGELQVGLGKATKSEEERQLDEDEDTDDSGENREDGVKHDNVDAEVDDDNNAPRGKYSRRKIVSNAWRYEEPEVDPYLEENKPAEEPEPDYARMTLGKTQLPEHVSDNEADAELDAFLGRGTLGVSGSGPTVTSKGKAIQVDRKNFQDINEKIMKQNAAEAFRLRFASRKKGGGSSDSGHPTDGVRSGVTGNDDDFDAFMGRLKLEDVRSNPSYPPQNEQPARIPITGLSHRGKDSTTTKLSEEEDDRWLDEMLGSGRSHAVPKRG